MSDSFEIERTEKLLHSRVFDIERRSIRHDDVVFERDVAVHKGAVAILAINDLGEIGFVRQYRAAFDSYLWEIPAGTRDVEGEDTLEPPNANYAKSSDARPSSGGCSGAS